MNLRKRLEERRKAGFDLEQVMNLFGGGLIAVLGLILIPAPAPGGLIFVAGMALLGTECEIIARCMDAAEASVRSWIEGLRQFARAR